MFFAIGWSNILSEKTVSEYLCVGMHPSDYQNTKEVVQFNIK